MVALIAVLVMTATTMNARASRSRRSVGSKAGRRCRIHTAASASSVFPVATQGAVHSGAPVVAFATSAPTQIAGQSERPQSSMAARAMPVGAHTVVICSATNANRNPNFAATRTPRPQRVRFQLDGRHRLDLEVPRITLDKSASHYARLLLVCVNFIAATWSSMSSLRISWDHETFAGRTTSCISAARSGAARVVRSGQSLARRWPRAGLARCNM